MRPHMRFVPIKAEDQQAALMLHKARELLVRQQTMLTNAIRGHMAELGMVAPQGSAKIKDLIAVIQDSEDQSIPACTGGLVQMPLDAGRGLDRDHGLASDEQSSACASASRSAAARAPGLA